ncbi:hypothetical protein F5883DRAFT_84245 [Diaporthe sp. PMI_573]|nr:hypothetical protein F5883DRAFT_84245 [Diaporthaceae sp. PMI_573]
MFIRWQGISCTCSNALYQRHHFQDSTTARTVLATILEIIAVSGNDLNQAYTSSDRRKCPMLKCFHISATPMDQIYHVAKCAEASKGEIQCWTCQKCHEFKKWQTMCNTLKSPVELLIRRLSNRKRGSNTSAGEPFATKRGKTAVNDDFAVSSRQKSPGFESMWLSEMEDPTSLLLHEVASNQNPAALELDAEANSVPFAMQPREFHTARPLPTPPSTRNHSWSENSQDLVAHGDTKVTNTPEQPPPYVVSPQTTVDDYQLHVNPTDSLRLGIPPVQYIHESSFMESPEDMELPEAPWADHAVFHEAEDSHIDLYFPSTVPNKTSSAQYCSPSEKTASIFSNSFPTPRMLDPRIQKQNTWPAHFEYSNNTPMPPPFEHQQRQTLDGVPGPTEQTVPAATRAKPSVERQTSFDAGTRDSITVSTVLEQRIQTGGGAPEEDKHQPPRARRGAGEQPQYEECVRCGQRFRGIPKNRRQHLKRHVETKHGDVRYRCVQPGCRRSYNRVDNLHDHERKCHRFIPQSEAVELSAGDVDIRGGGAAAAAATGGLAGGIGHQQDSSAMETHLDVFGYPIPTEDGYGTWEHRAGVDDDNRDLGARRRRSVGLLIAGEEWGVLDALVAGVSGGPHDEDEDAGRPDLGHDELAPRPLDLPCTSWRMLGG